MQPQGHVQVVVNTVDYHMNPQECLDAPRMQWTGGKRIQLEREVPAHIGLRLAEMGHQVEICNSNLDMGRGQIIWRMEDGTLAGGTEPRCDGTVAGLVKREERSCERARPDPDHYSPLRRPAVGGLPV